jgi:iron complex outermembrane receptor protein
MTRQRTLGSLSSSAALGLAAGLSAGPSHAEMIDHGVLERLFGEPITTSATGQPQRASEAPANMVIITADDIRRSGARDIAGVLSHVGGVDVAEWTSGHSDVAVRGYNREFTSRLLVLIDGRQVYADHYGFVPWNVLPVELGAIRQIEVVKGPNAALFGFNAVGGVVNIVTYNPMNDEIDVAQASAGSHELVGGSLVETFRIGERAAVRLSLGAHRGEDYDTAVPPQMGAGRNRDDERVSVALDGVVELSEHVHLALDASHVESSRTEVAPALHFVGADYTATALRGRLMADTPLGLLELSLYNNRITEIPEPLAVLGQLDFDNQVTVGRVQDLFTFGAAHTFRITGEYRTNSLNTTSVGGGLIHYDVYSAGGMWDWKVTPSLSFTNAARFDRLELGRDGAVPAGYPLSNADWSRTHDEVSLNSGLVWRVSESDTLRLIGARGVQLPNLTHLGGFLVTSPFINFTGVPTLEPSTITNFEIDWDRDLDAIGATMRAAVFHQTTEDVVNLEGGVLFGDGGAYLTQLNIGDSSAVGFELGVDGTTPTGWRWGLDYRYEDVEDDYGAPFDAIPVSSDYERTTPEHLFDASLGWSGGRWEVDGFLRRQSAVSGVLFPLETNTVELAPIDAFTALDGRVGFTLTDGASLALSGENLGAPEQRQTSGPEVERRLMGSLTVRY